MADNQSQLRLLVRFHKTTIPANPPWNAPRTATRRVNTETHRPSETPMEHGQWQQNNRQRANSIATADLAELK